MIRGASDDKRSHDALHSRKEEVFSMIRGASDDKRYSR